MTKAGARLLGAAQEAVAVAKGDVPAASITVKGHRYVPAERYKLLHDAAEDYLRECDNPVPDYAFRHLLRERLRKVVVG